MKSATLVFAAVLAVFTIPVFAADLADNPTGSPHGALAIDRSDGFYYGWSYDYSSTQEARRRALEECRSRGGDCTVVLDIHGAQRCGAYHTINGNVGTAYGWGKANTKAKASSIAAAECRSRSNGQQCSNQVWACNSETASNNKAPATQLNMSALRSAVTSYYNNEGEWAGQFRISNITQVRIDGSGSTIEAHVKYRFEPVGSNTRSGGNDQRIFTLDVSNGNYRVIRMGDYMSATF